MKWFKKRKNLQTKPESGLESTEMDLEKNKSQSYPPENNTHTNISFHQITYGKFLSILFDEESKPKNWNEILEEYIDAIKTPKSRSIFEVSKKVAECEWKMHLLFGDKEHMGAIPFLKEMYDQEIAEIIMLAGYDFIQPLKDREQYLKQIYRVETQAKTLVVLLNQYDKELQLLCPDGESTRTRMDYEKEIIMVSKVIGFLIKKDEIKLSEWCAAVNFYIEYSEINNAR